MSAIVGGGLTSGADAAAKLAEVNAAFDGTPTNPAHGFNQSFFNGTALQDGSGNDNPRLAAVIEDVVTMEYGVQANDPGIRELVKGLAMLASTDPDDISDPDAYETWVGAAASALQTGVSAVLDAETRTGVLQGQLEDTILRQQAKSDVIALQISNLESVDPYEAATRLTAIQTQLQASYAVTARMQELSFVNFMR